MLINSQSMRCQHQTSQEVAGTLVDYTLVGNYFFELIWQKLTLQCRKWGFKRWGFKQIRGYLRKKAFSLRFLDFPGALRPSGKGRKRQKKGRKGRLRPISRTGGQTPLKPPFVTPPFAALQLPIPIPICNYLELISLPLPIPMPTPWLSLLSRQSVLVFRPAARWLPRAEPSLNGPCPRPQQQRPPSNPFLSDKLAEKFLVFF